MVDIAVMVGSSGQDAVEKFKAQKMFINSLINRLDISKDTGQIASVLYEKEPLIMSRIGENVDRTTTKQTFDVIRNSLFSGNMDKALRLVKDTVFSVNQGARSQAPKSILMFIDTKAIGDGKKIDQLAKEFKDQNTKLVIVALGQDIDQATLKTLAYDQQSIFFPPSLEELQKMVEPVAKALLPG